MEPIGSITPIPSLRILDRGAGNGLCSGAARPSLRLIQDGKGEPLHGVAALPALQSIE